jgi:hypothetical protein
MICSKSAASGNLLKIHYSMSSSVQLFVVWGQTWGQEKARDRQPPKGASPDDQIREASKGESTPAGNQPAHVSREEHRKVCGPFWKGPTANENQQVGSAGETFRQHILRAASVGSRFRSNVHEED